MARKPRKAAKITPRPNPAEPFRCAIYTRQSRNPNRSLSSCQVQRDTCADFIRECGWLVIEEPFDDEGHSSETLERPALQRLLRAIEARQVERVVVTYIDRLTRRLLDLSKLLGIFQDHGVELSVVLDPRFGETASSRLLTNIVAAASQFQQELTRERMAETRSALKQKGRRVAGRLPYGYVSDPTSRQLKINPAAAGHVRQMFQMAAAGKRPTEIAVFANTSGWDGGAGTWTARRVLKMLSNPTYAGSIRNGSGILPGQHEPIVAPALFEQVRDTIVTRRSREPGRSKSPETWRLRGLLKCGRCGRPMSPSISGHGNVRYCYYRCRSSAGGRPPCEGVCVSSYQIEQFVRAQISETKWEDISPEQAEELKRFQDRWGALDEWTQTKRLLKIVREVVFDPDEETLTISLLDDAVLQLSQSGR